MKHTLLALALALVVSPLAHAQSAAVLVPAPVPTCTVGDTIVFTSATTTQCAAPSSLSQPLTDALALIRNATDGTKTLKFSLAGLMTATERVWSIPDANLTIPATIASLGANTFTGTQTATAFSGDGALLTALNATQLTSGTVPLARLVDITNGQIAAAAAIAYSKLALTGSIVNTDVNASAAIDWSKISKTGSSLADFTTRSATDLTSGTLPDARFPATLPAISGANLTSLDATELTGTIASARLSGAYTGITALGTLTGLTASGTFNVTGTGPHAIGGATSNWVQLSQTGTFQGAGAGYDALSLLTSTLQSNAGRELYGVRLAPTFVESASGTHPLLATQRIDAATVTDGLATVTDTASLYIAGPMTAAVTGANYALWVDAGDARFDGNVTSGAEVVSGAAIRVGPGSVLYWLGRSRIDGGTTDGVVTLWNSSQTDFSRLQFGGTTSAFPALKRSGNALMVRLADDTNAADLHVKELTASSTVSAGATLGLGWAGRAYMFSPDANTIEQRNGLNAQKLNLYDAYTDAANHGRFSVGALGTLNGLTDRYGLYFNTAGTGTVRNVDLGTSGAASVSFITAAIHRWNFNPSGHLLAVTDNTYDIGNSTTDPRHVYAATSLRTRSYIHIAAAANIFAPSDGVITLYDNGQTNFARLQFGGTTSAFPSIKRSGADLEFRKADDSARSSVYMATAYMANAEVATSVTIGTNSATTGALRLVHGGDIYARNSLNTLDLQILTWGSVADELSVGTAAAPTRIRTSLVTVGSPANGDWWVDCTGTSPTRVCAIKVRDGATTRTIGSITF